MDFSEYCHFNKYREKCPIPFLTLDSNIQWTLRSTSRCISHLQPPYFQTDRNLANFASQNLKAPSSDI
jgi:hypothetical protein